MRTYLNSCNTFDAHIHIGQFYNKCLFPKKLVAYLDSIGVSRFAVSSTTTCEENYKKIIEEFNQLLNIADNRCIPVLWITPKMIRTWTAFSMFEQGINWKCLKIHPQLHPTEWGKGSANLNFVASMASVWRIPLLIHTGELAGCYPFEFDDVISRRFDVTFILAHGRPIGQTIEMMKKYPNVWCDTAFMPTENIVKLCKENLSERVLWGSDYPIPKYYYPDVDMKTYYLDLVQKLKNSVSQEDFEKITHKNFEKLFGK